MRHGLIPAILLLALPVCAGQVVDRMVAVVNRHVVLQSELEQEVRIDIMLRGLPLEQANSAEMDAMLERLIDQSLLQQQIMNTAMIEPGPEELKEGLSNLRSQLPGVREEEAWQKMLAAYGVTERDVEAHIASQLRLLRFIDLRFRSVTRIDRGAVNTFYQEQYLPERRRQGLPDVPLDEVSRQIEKLLSDQRVNDLLNTWLSTLRAQSSIQKLATVSGLSAGGRP